VPWTAGGGHGRDESATAASTSPEHADGVTSARLTAQLREPVRGEDLAPVAAIQRELAVDEPDGLVAVPVFAPGRPVGIPVCAVGILVRPSSPRVPLVLDGDEHPVRDPCEVAEHGDAVGMDVLEGLDRVHHVEPAGVERGQDVLDGAGVERPGRGECRKYSAITSKDSSLMSTPVRQS